MQKENNNSKTDVKKVAKTKTMKNKQIRFFPYVTIVVLLVVLVLGGYYFYLNKARSNSHSQRLQQQISENQQQITQLQTQLQQLNVQQSQLADEIKQYGLSNQQWFVSSARYLIRQAQLKLIVEHDVPTAIVLLQTAQQRISAVNSIKLNTLAAALAKDISDLKALPVVDLNSIHSQFNSLLDIINTLSLGLIAQQQPAKEESMASEQGWKKALHSSLHALRNIVVVQRTDRKFTLLLQQQQLASFKQYLQSLAQQAFWGALNDDAGLYHQSLTAIATALQHYILPSNKNSQLIQAQVLKLQKLKVASALPKQLSAAIVIKKLQTQAPVTMQGKVK